MSSQPQLLNIKSTMHINQIEINHRSLIIKKNVNSNISSIPSIHSSIPPDIPVTFSVVCLFWPAGPVAATAATVELVEMVVRP